MPALHPVRYISCTWLPVSVSPPRAMVEVSDSRAGADGLLPGPGLLLLRLLLWMPAAGSRCGCPTPTPDPSPSGGQGTHTQRTGGRRSTDAWDICLTYLFLPLRPHDYGMGLQMQGRVVQQNCASAGAAALAAFHRKTIEENQWKALVWPGGGEPIPISESYQSV